MSARRATTVSADIPRHRRGPRLAPSADASTDDHGRAAVPQLADTPPGARLLSILEAVARCEGPVASADLVPQVGLPKATVHRLCRVLENLGYLQREAGSKRFVIGYRQQQLALNSLINAGDRGARHAILEALAHEVGKPSTSRSCRATGSYISIVSSHGGRCASTCSRVRASRCTVVPAACCS